MRINPPIRGSIDEKYEITDCMQLYQSPYKGFNSNIAGLEIDLDHCLNPPIRGSIGKLRAAGYKDESFCLNPPIRGSIEMTREVEFLFRERASINPPIRGSIVDEKNKHYYGIRINPPIRGSIGESWKVRKEPKRLRINPPIRGSIGGQR